MTKECGFDMVTAVKSITETPAKLLKIKKGRLATGYDADIAVFDDDVNVSAVFVNGKKEN